MLATVVRPDGLFRLPDLDPREPGRLEVQGLGRDLDARRDGPAEVLALGRDGVERGRGAEIHDDARPAVFLVGGDGATTRSAPTSRGFS